MATFVESAPPTQVAQRSGSFRNGLLTAVLILLVLPLAIGVVFSFGNSGPNGGYAPGLTLANYSAALAKSGPFVTSLWLAIAGTILCLLAGLPMAYFIATRGG